MFPEKTIQIKIKENSYTVNYPSNRQLIAISAQKEQLCSGAFDSLANSRNADAVYASMLAEAIATFETLMPAQFFKDLNVQSLRDLDVIAGAELVKAYRDYQEWFDKWSEEIAIVLNSSKDEKAE